MYGVDHLSMEALSQLAGIKLTHMPTAGAGPAMTAVLAGHVEASVLNPATVSAQLSAGTVRALAITGAERLKDIKGLENVPTLKELGFNYEMYLWWGLFAPKGTPAPIVLKLRGVLKQICEDSSFQKLMGNMGFVLRYRSGEDLEKRYGDEVVTLGNLIKSLK
jgi:tripartite-type tricarboxylate transporter receptor subunit TctC